MRATATSVFVGRDAELCVLRDAFGDASAGQPQVVVVEGEAGIGKTTLVERFVSDLPTSRLLKASGDESESHVPFAMADQLLRAQGSASDALDSGRHVAIGLELLELISSDPEDGPCVVFGDDAHLIDPESLRALLFAARRLVASRAVVVLVVRGTAEEALPQGWRKLASGSTGGVLSVGPLAPAHISALGTALGVDMTPEAAGRLCEHTRGNPLHARAVLRELPEDAGWQHEHRTLPVPKSYAQLVRERLDRCPAHVVSLIEAAAVLGVRAPMHAVVELASVERPLEMLDDAMPERPGAPGRPRGGQVRRVLAPVGSRRDLRRPAHGATQRAQRRGGADRRRPGRGDAPSRRGRDRRRRARCSTTSKRTRTPRCRAARGRAPCRA